MPLIEEKRRPPSPLQLRPVVTGVAALAASVVFVIVIAVVARATADGVVLPERDAGFVDAGEVVVDAGVEEFSDAGVVVTVSRDAGVEVGPPAVVGVDGPPFDAREVVGVAAVVVEGCASEALRWDPSLGGAFSLVVDLPVGAPVAILVDGLTSPVLTSCLSRRGDDAAWPTAVRSSTLAVPLRVHARAKLAGSGEVTWSDAAVTSGPEAPKVKVNEGAQPE